MKKNETVTARFHSDGLIFTPHGLGVSYTNANLTDKAARDILAADPDAARHFAVLPPEATAEETVAEQSQAPGAGTPAPATAQPAAAAGLSAGFDYQALAKAMFDEGERRELEARDKALAGLATPPAAPTTETHTDEVTLTAQPGGQGADGVTTASTPPAVVEVTTGTTAPASDAAGAGTASAATDASPEGEKPVRLSRMGKDLLIATYRAELKLEPADDLTNDQLREAIAGHRESQASPE